MRADTGADKKNALVCGIVITPSANTFIHLMTAIFDEFRNSSV
jgi:hypothetical protein